MGLTVRTMYVLLFLAMISNTTMARRELKSVSLATVSSSCAEVNTTLSACVNLGNLVTIGINTKNDSCCKALGTLVGIGVDIGAQAACQCTRNFLSSLPIGILFPISLNTLVSACGVTGINFQLASNAVCPSNNTQTPSIPPILTPSRPSQTPSTPPSRSPTPAPANQAPHLGTPAPTPLASPNCSIVNTTLSSCVLLGNLVTIGANPTNDPCCKALGSLVNIQANIGASITCQCARGFLSGLSSAIPSPVNLNSQISACGITGIDVQLASNAVCPSNYTQTPSIPPVITSSSPVPTPSSPVPTPSSPVPTPSTPSLHSPTPAPNISKPPTPLALPPTPNPSIALNCSTVNTTLSFCVRLGTLVTIGSNTQSDQCCIALRNLVNVQASLGAGRTCQCTKSFLGSLLIAQLGPVSLSSQISTCGITGLNNFQLASNAACPT